MRKMHWYGLHNLCLYTKVRAETPGLLTNNNFIHFVVEWRHGHIKVKKDGAILLEWQDPNPFGISHYGVRTAWGSKGHWKIRAQDPKSPAPGTGQPLTCLTLSSSQAVLHALGSLLRWQFLRHYSLVTNYDLLNTLHD